jgi:hypothetical protein
MKLGLFWEGRILDFHPDEEYLRREFPTQTSKPDNSRRVTTSSRKYITHVDYLGMVRTGLHHDQE